MRAGDGIAFRHGLIGEVVYERLLPSERVELHRAIAAALDDAPAAQLAHQCYRAGPARRGAGGLGEAGIEAADVHAFAEARVHFERALELWDDVALRWTASSCSRAPPRPRASPATLNGPSRAAARRSR